MITDAYNTLTVSTGTLASGSSIFSSDAVDLRLSGTSSTAGDLGEGTTLYVSLFVTTSFAGAAGATAAISIGMATDAAGTGYSTIYATSATGFASLPASSSTDLQAGHLETFAIKPLKSAAYGPYLLLRITGGGGANLTAGTIRAHISLEPYDAKQIGIYASGYTVL
jgi:hypothetical protein